MDKIKNELYLIGCVIAFASLTFAPLLFWLIVIVGAIYLMLKGLAHL